MELSRERKRVCKLREALDNDYLVVDNQDERTSSLNYLKHVKIKNMRIREIIK